MQFFKTISFKEVFSQRVLKHYFSWSCAVTLKYISETSGTYLSLPELMQVLTLPYGDLPGVSVPFCSLVHPAEQGQR